MTAPKKLNNRPTAVKPRPVVRVEPLEYASSGEKGEDLSLQVKRRPIPFYEGINNET